MTRRLIIGAGPGGTHAAMVLAQEGTQVILVDSGADPGGQCSVDRYISSKIFHDSARRLRELREAPDFGLCVHGQNLHLNWSAVQARRLATLRRRREALAMRARQYPSLEIIEGSARFLSPRSAQVTTHEGEVDTIDFDQAVIATGSVAFRPRIRGVDHSRVLDSDQILSVDAIPEKLVIIGSDPLGIEFGQIFHTFGSRVSLLEQSPQILKSVDPDLAERLHQRMRADGIEVITDCQLNAILNTGGGVFAQYTQLGAEKTSHFADLVLLAYGRQTRLDGIGLENTAINYDSNGISVNEQLQTDESRIFAIGDAVGQPMFAQWAAAQGLAVGDHLLGKTAAFPKLEHNCAVIFSEPELGMAGLNEEQARSAGIKTNVVSYEYAQDAQAQIMGRDAGLLKIVYDRQTRRLVGLQALVEDAHNLIGEATIAIRAGITIEDIAAVIHPLATVGESLSIAARAAETSR